MKIGVSRTQFPHLTKVFVSGAISQLSLLDRFFRLGEEFCISTKSYKEYKFFDIILYTFKTMVSVSVSDVSKSLCKSHVHKG